MVVWEDWHRAARRSGDERQLGVLAFYRNRALHSCACKRLAPSFTARQTPSLLALVAGLRLSLPAPHTPRLGPASKSAHRLEAAEGTGPVPARPGACAAAPPPPPATTMKLVGLTGGIACGKSTVSRLLASAHGMHIIDADLIARAVVDKASSLRAVHGRWWALALAHTMPPDFLPAGALGLPPGGARLWDWHPAP